MGKFIFAQNQPKYFYYYVMWAWGTNFMKCRKKLYL